LSNIILQNKSKPDKKKNWLVYMILCSDESLYTGITNDIIRRFEQHKTKKGAKYFYGRQPKKIVFIEQGHDRVTASQREYEIKKFTKEKKIALINGNS
jgi:putative endonuclease